MPTSLFLAKLIGPLFLAVGVGLIANAAVYKKLAEEFLASLALIYLSGLLAMTAGMAIILSHNVWALDGASSSRCWAGSPRSAAPCAS